MTERGYPTSLGVSTEATISLLGEDLTDLMGSVGFGGLTYWLMTLRRPSPGEARVLEAVLVIDAQTLYRDLWHADGCKGGRCLLRREMRVARLATGRRA